MVTFLDPMKRGLKVHLRCPIRHCDAALHSLTR